MSILKNETYRRLGLDSSNLMMDWDGHRIQGRYEEGARVMLEAAAQRLRMGQMCFEEGFFSLAADDWLCAAACFADATSLRDAEKVLEEVRAMEAQGTMPTEGPQLSTRIREGEVNLEQLNRKIQVFLATLNPRSFPASPTEELLTFLLKQRRDLPGLAELHLAIYRTASALGHADLAATHQKWAAVFTSGHAGPTAPGGYPSTANGSLQEVKHLASESV